MLVLDIDLQFFGGRGASSASGSSTGGGGGGNAVTAANAGGGGAAVDDQNTTAQADDTQQAQPMSSSYQSFMSMSDDDKADYIDSVAQKAVPVFLADNAFQRFTYNSQMNDKPQIVDDKTLDSMTGTEMFRTINGTYNSRSDIGYRADEIAAQIAKGSVTRVSDTGGSVYGRGIYFATSYSGSTAYGNRRGDVKKTAVMRCKLNSNAKTISYNGATSGLRKEMASGSKLGRSLAKIARTDNASAVSLYALSKGYNVIDNGMGYLNILNRNAVTVSSSVKPMGSSW